MAGALLAADAFGDVTAPLLIIAGCTVVAVVALTVARRRTLRARSASLPEWQADHGPAVDAWVAAVDACVEGSGADAPARDDAAPDLSAADLAGAVEACPDRRLHRELVLMGRYGRLACRRAAKGRAPGHDHRSYEAARSRAAGLMPEAEAVPSGEASLSGGRRPEPLS